MTDNKLSMQHDSNITSSITRNQAQNQQLIDLPNYYLCW